MADDEAEHPGKRQKTAIDATITWIIYPPPIGSRPSFEVGDRVYFRPKSAKERGRKGRVVECVGKPEEDVKDHLWVQFEGTSKCETGPAKPKSVSSKRLVPVYAAPDDDDEDATNDPQTKTVILTPETIPYRHMACSQVCETDDILEIGCSTGEASVILLRYGRSLVGFDTSNDMIKKCLSRLKLLDDRNVESATKELRAKSFDAIKIDALKDTIGAVDHACKFSGEIGPSVVFLDIGGNRDKDGVLEMMAWVLNSFSSLRLLVVKSREVADDITATGGASSFAGAIFEAGSAWFQNKLNSKPRLNLLRHPLQAPLVFSPTSPNTPICRYFNFHKDGCSKGSRCPFDHEHCHICLQRGHKAIQCDMKKKEVI